MPVTNTFSSSIGSDYTGRLLEAESTGTEDDDSGDIGDIIPFSVLVFASEEGRVDHLHAYI